MSSNVKMDFKNDYFTDCAITVEMSLTAPGIDKDVVVAQTRK